jgi:hypothetical protein
MPREAIEELRDSIKDRERHLRLDQRGIYEILLGRGVIDSMIETLGEDGSRSFLDGMRKFDIALERSNELDLFELIPVHQITAFKSFKEYVAMLRGLLTKLKMMKDDDAVVVRKTLEELLELANAERKTVETTKVTAGAKMLDSAPKYGSNRFHGNSLPGVPLSTDQSELLPYSYPDFDETLATVVGHCKRSGFNTTLRSDLNKCMKTSLAALALKRKYVDHVESDPRDYLVEAQSYLRDVNWLGYGLSSRKLVTAAVARGAKAEIDHGIGTIVLSCVRTEAYAFLGSNLEMVLRRSVVALAKDVLANYSFTSRQSGVDVVVSASSRVVQDTALVWLEKLNDAFDRVAEAQ